jgi:hypothetical protein
LTGKIGRKKEGRELHGWLHQQIPYHYKGGRKKEGREKKGREGARP